MTQQTMTGFQTLVNRQPAPGQAGDFYGVNARAVVLAGPGQLQAPAGGLIVGNFAWADLTTGVVSQGYDANGQIGLLHRDEQAIIVTYLGISTYVMNAGFPVTLFSQVDQWALFAAGATPGQKVYAAPVDGSAVAGGANPPTVSTFTGAITTGVLTVTAPAGLPLGKGAVIAGAGVTAGNQITAQLTGTPGGAGTYQLSVADTGISAEAMTVAAIATPWKVKSKAGAGEVAKISTWGK